MISVNLHRNDKCESLANSRLLFLLLWSSNSASSFTLSSRRWLIVSLSRFTSVCKSLTCCSKTFTCLWAISSSCCKVSVEDLLESSSIIFWVSNALSIWIVNKKEKNRFTRATNRRYKLKNVLFFSHCTAPLVDKKFKVVFLLSRLLQQLPFTSWYGECDCGDWHRAHTAVT